MKPKQIIFTHTLYDQNKIEIEEIDYDSLGIIAWRVYSEHCMALIPVDPKEIFKQFPNCYEKMYATCMLEYPEKLSDYLIDKKIEY